MNVRKRLHSFGHQWALSLVLLVYLILQFSLLQKPGLEQDEAVFLVPSMELAQGREISYGYSVDLFGIHYPTMLGGYTGNSLTLPVALAVRAFGFSLSLVRSLWVIVGAVTILLTFLAFRELFNNTVGLLAGLLLSINPSFWMFSHVGAYCSASMTFDVMGSLFFFLHFYRTRRQFWLFWAMFLTGHGIYTKLAFGYFLTAYLISFGYLWIRKRLNREIITPRNLSVSVTAFILGGWPFLYNLATNSQSTLVPLKTTLLGASLSGESNLQLWHNLMVRIEQTRIFLLEGRAPIDTMVAGVPVIYDMVLPYFFVGSLVFFLGALAWPGQRVIAKDRIAFLVLVFFVFQLLIVFTPSSLNLGVYAFIPPFTSAILALAIYLLFKLVRSKVPSNLGWVVVVAAGVLVFGETRALWSQYDAIRRTGGRGVWSSTIFQVNEYLHQNRDREIVAMDWGLDYPIYVLSNLSMKPVSAYYPFTLEGGSLKLWHLHPPPEFKIEMEKLIFQAQNAYLAREEAGASFKDRLPVLKQVVWENGGQLEKIQSFFEGNGQEFIGLYQVRWPGGHPPLPQFNELAPSTDIHPHITNVYPEHSVVGAKFNQQSGGTSAIAIRGEGFDPSSTVWFNDEPLLTTYGSGELVTAVVPDKFIQSAGEIKVFVVNQGRFKSNTQILSILPK